MKYLKGNLLEAQTKALVNTVNTVGVMGKGIALQFKEAFPENYNQYVTACKNNSLTEVSHYIKKELTPEQLKRLSNLIKLIDGFQSALSLEILATVDYIKKNNPGISQADIVTTINNWSDRKRKLFQVKYIQIADNHLQEYSNRLDII